VSNEEEKRLNRAQEKRLNVAQEKVLSDSARDPGATRKDSDEGEKPPEDGREDRTT
jgi:hypothetical protein